VEKIANLEIPEKALDELKRLMKEDKLSAAMIMYVDDDNNMFMYGDAHSIAMLVTNLTFVALHEHLHQAESEFQQREKTGGFDILKGFQPDDPSV
jgi:hypothetical protein